MQKKHIIDIGYMHFAVDSVTTATAAIAILSKLTRVKTVYHDGHRGKHYEPDPDGVSCSLEMNQNYCDPAKDKPKKAPKSLALPAPKRGTILCICERSYVAPRESCSHCGRAFSESHNRTHKEKSTGPQLRLI